MTPHWNLPLMLYILQTLLILDPIVVASKCFRSLQAEVSYLAPQHLSQIFE